MAHMNPHMMVATYSSPRAAARALEQLQQDLPEAGIAMPRGALLTRTPDGGLNIRELHDTGVSDVASSALDVALFLGIGTARIAWTTLRDGASLLVRSTSRMAALAGALAVLPLQKVRGAVASNEQLRRIGDQLETGATAVVLITDAHGENLAQLCTLLAKTGGRIVQGGVAENEAADVTERSM